MLFAQFENYLREKNKDKDLWIALKGGQRDALAKLFQCHHRHLYNYGMKILANREIINESIQDLFLNLWETHDSLSLANSVKAYLLSSLRRFILKRKKRIENRAERNKKYIANRSDTVFSVEHLSIHKEVAQEKREELKQGLQALTPRQREAVFLKFQHGLTNKELVDVMGINYQCVRNLLYDAIKRLRSHIASMTTYQE